MTDLVAHSVWILLALVLVGSSLAMRRLPTRDLGKLVLLWVVIFAVVWLAVRLVAGEA